jgi:hypothetical protein
MKHISRPAPGRLLTLLLLLWLPYVLAAQSLLYVRNGCAVNDAEMGQNHYVFDPSDEAQRIIRTIMEANFLEPNFVIKSGDVENALATVEAGQRYIIYNTTYVERIKRSGGSDWPAFYVFAHEIGHHLSNHRFDLNDNAKSKEQELKADVFAGGMLYRLGATLDQAQIGIGNDFKEGGSNTHPPRRARLEAVANGWKKAYDQSGGVQPMPVVIKGAIKPDKTNDRGGVQPDPGGTTESSLGDSYMDPLVGTMVLVKGGDVRLSDTYTASLSNYYIGQTEVTQAQWRAVMGSNPSRFEDCDDCPVEQVSWDDVQDFIAKLNRRGGGARYRLPTEAEWEYAARGGSKSRGFEFAGSSNIDEVAWHNGNSGSKTRPVKGKKPNELGLYDMSGNVWEWCSDWYGDYPNGKKSDPTGPSSGSYRVIRGGSWNSFPEYCRVARRNFNYPVRRYNDFGFRLVFVP